MEDSATSHEWELNRENIRPLRGGCNVESLNSVFGGPRFTLADADAKFEEDFKAAETSEDPLEICCTFVLWFENNFPTGKQAHLYRYLQRIINSYGYKEEYINDERMMKMWFKLADSKSGQLSGSVLLERAFNAGCCRCLAKFYVRWAEIREDANDISGARTVLELGRRNNAQPGEMLIAASDALEMRQIRLLSEEDSDLEWSQPEEYEEQRLALGGLKGIGRNKAAPAMRFAERTAEGLLSNHQDLQSSTKPQQKSVFTVFEGSPCDEPILVPQDFTAELGHVEFVQNTKDPMKWKDARITGSRKCVARENPTFRVFDETAYQQKRHDKKELSKNSKLVVANEKDSVEEIMAATYSSRNFGLNK